MRNGGIEVKSLAIFFCKDELQLFKRWSDRDHDYREAAAAARTWLSVTTWNAIAQKH